MTNVSSLQTDGTNSERVAMISITKLGKNVVHCLIYASPIPKTIQHKYK